MLTKCEPYDKDSDYSYALGLFPCFALMESRPELAQRLLLSPEAESSEGAAKLRALCEKHGVREEFAERVLRRESKKENCFAAIAFEKKEFPPLPDKNHAVFCQISDFGNLGTALRALLGFGIRDAALIRPCVDFFDPRALRASMGAAFKMRVRTYPTFEAYKAEVGARSLYPFMLDGAIPLNQAVRGRGEPFSLVFGNEQTGLPPSFQREGQSVFIPQSKDVDSFNLAVAASVAAYAFTQEA